LKIEPCVAGRYHAESKRTLVSGPFDARAVPLGNRNAPSTWKTPVSTCSPHEGDDGSAGE
jgi:hypothetical protein